MSLRTIAILRLTDQVGGGAAPDDVVSLYGTEAPGQGANIGAPVSYALDLPVDVDALLALTGDVPADADYLYRFRLIRTSLPADVQAAVEAFEHPGLPIHVDSIDGILVYDHETEQEILLTTLLGMG